MRLLEHFPNLVTMFFARAVEKGDAPFLWRRRESGWVPISWRETAERVAALAAALREQGLQPGDRVMLVSENRPEWCIADLAIMAAGCVTVPAYTSNTTHDHTHVLENSGVKAVIVSTAKLAATLIPAVLRAGQVKLVVGIDPMKIGQQGPFAVCTFDALTAPPGDVVDCADSA
jgi:long-chain acyl-CoA synthetase